MLGEREPSIGFSVEQCAVKCVQPGEAIQGLAGWRVDQSGQAWRRLPGLLP